MKRAEPSVSILARLEQGQKVIQFVAILVAGGWTFYEHVYTIGREREQRKSYGWLTTKLEVNTARVDPKTVAVHMRLVASNPSQRYVEPFFVLWNAYEPSSKKPIFQRVTTRFSEIKPGETTEDSIVEILTDPPPVIVAHAETFLISEKSGERCILDPAHHGPETVLDELTTSPYVCEADPKESQRCKNASTGCSYQFATQMFTISSPIAENAKGSIK